MDHQWYLGRLLYGCGAHWWSRTIGYQLTCHSLEGRGSDSPENVQLGCQCQWYARPSWVLLRLYHLNIRAGSTFIELDDVRVPADHLIGEENKGFPLIMSSKFRESYPRSCG